MPRPTYFESIEIKKYKSLKNITIGHLQPNNINVLIGKKTLALGKFGSRRFTAAMFSRAECP